MKIGYTGHNHVKLTILHVDNFLWYLGKKQKTFVVFSLQLTVRSSGEVPTRTRRKASGSVAHRAEEVCQSQREESQVGCI